MIRYRRPIRAFAICLSTVAGYVDAVGFVALGGFFVSFMSGNSTRMSVGLASGSSDAKIAGGLIVSFVTGVLLGSLTSRVIQARRRPAALLGLTAVGLALASTLATIGMTGAVLPLVAGAMGVKNTVFERDGEVSIGLTYMTGTLVKLGQRLATALSQRGDVWGWVPYVLMWLGLVGGAVFGAIVYKCVGLLALWPAAAAELILALVAFKLGPQIDADQAD